MVVGQMENENGIDFVISVCDQIKRAAVYIYKYIAEQILSPWKGESRLR